MTLDQLVDESALAAALSGATFLLFKHSRICPVSVQAFGEYRRFLSNHDGPIASAWIDVIEGRPLSRAVEERTGVRHESPQALLVSGDSVLWHASHAAITTKTLESAWAEHSH